MESVKKARQRLKNYPKLIAECAIPAKNYARCVTQYMGEVKQNACLQEFTELKNCVKNTVFFCHNFEMGIFLS